MSKFVKRVLPVGVSIVGVAIVGAIVGIAAFVAFSRWPTGAAVGTGRDLLATTQPISRPVIRLAAFNIHSGVGADGTFNLDRTADTLRDCDLAGLTEVRGGFSSNQANDLGKKLSLNSLFSPNERTLFHDDFGNALLTRLPVTAWQRVPIPDTQLAHHRNVVILRTTIERQPLTVMIAHVVRGPDRANQLDYLYQLFSGFQSPVVIMGDLNTEHDDPLLLPFLQNSLDAIAAHNPADPHRIDWIFVRGLDVPASGLVDKGASDHPLVWADVTLPRE
ncbi:MAG: endonuclease/exonuclease/phosphatase family protein [Tepidisphaeraceae bacterium]